MGELCMPSLGADMDAGTLVEWHVAPGAHVKRGEVVAAVETQKGLIEVEIWESGTIDRLLVQPGMTVPVGTVLALVRGDAAPLGAPAPIPMRAPAPAPSPVAAPAPVPAPSPAPAPPPGAAPSHVRASPAARQLARDYAIDLASVSPTGPHGAVTRDDVARAAGHAPTPAPTPTPKSAAMPAPKASATAQTAAMRKAIAAAMTRSKREIPHYYLSQDIEVATAVRWLEEQNGARPPSERVLFATLLVKATAITLRDFPELNGFFVDGEVCPSPRIHVGIAISLRQGGLVAPAIHDTDTRPLGDLMVALGDLVARARAGTLRSSEMSDPTITITNLGDQGADAVFGVIYPPQVALIGFGTVRERPWAQNGLLGVRPVVTASLSGDHRASDGHRGARFLASLARRLEHPEELA